MQIHQMMIAKLLNKANSSKKLFIIIQIHKRKIVHFSSSSIDLLEYPCQIFNYALVSALTSIPFKEYDLKNERDNNEQQ